MAIDLYPSNPHPLHPCLLKGWDAVWNKESDPFFAEDFHSRTPYVKRKYWRKRWFLFTYWEGLRERYGDDEAGKQRYYADYPLEGGAMDYLACGMAALRRLEGKMVRQARELRYSPAGTKALEMFLASLSTHVLQPGAGADPVFIAVDFEGQHNHRGGLKEFGVAQLDVRGLFGDPQSAKIHASNYNIKAAISRTFAHGNTITIKTADFASTITKCLRDGVHGERDALPNRKVVLVGHSLDSDIRRMEDFGVPVETHGNVVGVLDTWDLAKEPLGCTPTLLELLHKLKIPWRCGSLHCAGNDAHFTMQALLALLFVRMKREKVSPVAKERLDRMLQLARQPVPFPPPLVKEEVDWAENMGSDLFATLSSEGCDESDDN